jgi:hypothetical protein
MEPYRFSHPTLNAVALYGIPQHLASRQPDARTQLQIRFRQWFSKEWSGGDAHSFVLL